MRILLALLTIIACIGCAGTTIKHGTTKVKFQCNAKDVFYKDAYCQLHVVDMDHSTPTLAGGHAVGYVIDKGGKALTSMGLVYFTGGAGGPVVSGVSKLSGAGLSLLQSPAPVTTK